MEYSGMSITLGQAFATTGWLFPFFAAFLGWLGVFMTGSDTSTNALFGKLQAYTAQQIGIDPVITMNANTSGGVCGKMISPQSIAVATGATGLVGKEADIFRFTFKHSLILTTAVGIIVMLQTYVFTWMIPPVEKAVAAAKAAVDPEVAKAAAAAAFQSGLMFLGIAAIVVVLVVIISRVVGKNLDVKAGGESELHFH
jgi:lactate permease